MNEKANFQKPVAELLADGGSDGGTKPFFYDIENLPTVGGAELLDASPPELRSILEKGKAGESSLQTILSSPTLSIIRYVAPPGMSVPPHHHGVSQITYVLKGELRYGTQVTRAGMGFFTPGKKYSWTAGAEGAEFLEVFAGVPAGTFTA
jgi:hypothetical protein